MVIPSYELELNGACMVIPHNTEKIFSRFYFDPFTVL